MEVLLAIIIGLLYTLGLYMILRRSMVKLIIGLALLSHGANLLIFTVGRITKGIPAFIEKGQYVANDNIAEPIPQALILTAIVIGFGIQAFALVLLRKVYQSTGTDDINDLKSTDRIDLE